MDDYEHIDKYSKGNNYQIIKECAKDISSLINELSKGNLKSTSKNYLIEKYKSTTKLLFGNLANIN